MTRLLETRQHPGVIVNAGAIVAYYPSDLGGPGYLSSHLYCQDGRLGLHVLYLSGANEWPAYAEEHLPVSPLRVRVS